ncbi:MAG: hypothetical protein WC464_00765 [Bdellovibrionales bacterium]
MTAVRFYTGVIDLSGDAQEKKVVLVERIILKNVSEVVSGHSGPLRSIVFKGRLDKRLDSGKYRALARTLADCESVHPGENVTLDLCRSQLRNAKAAGITLKVLAP